jgi:two-component system cell cycle sensor histidine kinase/response regulator CckA
MLEGDGYHVIEAENGAKAVTLLKDHRTVHVLMADLEMPELAGEEMVRQLREKRPDLRVLYVTGHVDRLFSERPVLREGEAFVEKPFTSEQLLEAISLLLYGTFKRPK